MLGVAGKSHAKKAEEFKQSFRALCVGLWQGIT